MQRKAPSYPSESMVRPSLSSHSTIRGLRGGLVSTDRERDTETEREDMIDRRRSKVKGYTVHVTRDTGRQRRRSTRERRETRNGVNGQSWCDDSGHLS